MSAIVWSAGHDEGTLTHLSVCALVGVLQTLGWVGTQRNTSRCTCDPTGPIKIYGLGVCLEGR
jgi:hypothetical protein